MAGVANRFQDAKLPPQTGEQARIKVVDGPDLGSTFVVFSPPVRIGRGENNEIVLSDLKSSRVHCEIGYTQGSWYVRDLKSSNGIFLNGQKVEQRPLRSGDVITLGTSTFEFMEATVGARRLSDPPRSLQVIESQQKALANRSERVSKMAQMGGGYTHQPKPKVETPGGDNSTKRRIVLYGVLGVLGYVLLMEDTPQDQTKKDKTKTEKTAAKDEEAKQEEARKLATFDEQYLAPEQRDEAKRQFRLGFREFRERNYLRARLHFRTALQVDGGHRLARLYLSNVEKEIKDEVIFHLSEGKKDFAAGKLKKSKGHYEAVLRLLRNQELDEGLTANFKEAQEQLIEVQSKMKEQS